MLRTHRVRSLAVLVALALLGLVMAPAAPAEAAKKAPAKFVIVGSGAGHGVGMSQYGAYELARTGSSAEQILQYYYPGTAVGWTTNNPRTVKVQVLGPPVDKRKTATIKVKGAFSVADAAGRVLSSTSSSNVTLTVKGSMVTAKLKKKSLTASRLTVTTTGVATVTGAQGSYHYGNLQVTSIGKRLNVVNEVAMNTEYLYGLDEMPASWGNYGGAEALKAQAIAARNYVIKRVVKLRETLAGVDTGDPACDCHIFDDERSQNYTGWKKAGPSANQPWVTAVESTMTPTDVQILRDPSAGFAETPYFASTGFAPGAGTAGNSDVFKADPLSYLPGVADPHSAKAPGNPYRSWKRTLTQKQAAKLFSLKSIAKIEVTETYAGGLMKTLTATATNGRTATRTKTGAAWMQALGVPSPWLTTIKPK